MNFKVWKNFLTIKKNTSVEKISFYNKSDVKDNFLFYCVFFKKNIGY